MALEKLSVVAKKH